MAYYVYILASKPYGTLYIGFSSELARRVYEHKQEAIPGFTKTYGIKTLVHYETYDDINLALQRERNLKRWKRDWKIDLINQNNPNWDDPYDTLQS